MVSTLDCEDIKPKNFIFLVGVPPKLLYQRRYLHSTASLMVDNCEKYLAQELRQSQIVDLHAEQRECACGCQHTALGSAAFYRVPQLYCDIDIHYSHYSDRRGKNIDTGKNTIINRQISTLTDCFVCPTIMIVLIDSVIMNAISHYKHFQ